MLLVFILQVSAAVAGFILMSSTRLMVSDQLNVMMAGRLHQIELDWIQSKVSFGTAISLRHK